MPVSVWGRLPYQSVRLDQIDATLRYRFDGLKAGHNYTVHLTFWQKEGSTKIQKIYLDGIDTNQDTNSGDFQIHHVSIAVPAEDFQVDGSIVVTIERLGASGAMVSEIALEEDTLGLSLRQWGEGNTLLHECVR